MIELTSPQQTDIFGQTLAHGLVSLDRGLTVSLVGELGAGKTALTRAVLAGLGYSGRVVSPSYTLIEPYVLGARTLFHMDLYRLGDPEELEFLAIRDIDTACDWLFVEWAERGAGHLPATDVCLELAYVGPESPTARTVDLSACSDKGNRFLEALDSSG